MNLETKIIIYKFTPQVFTLTLHRSRDFYEDSIRNDLKDHGASIVSCHASIESGIKIYYDPNHEISLDDLATLSGSEMCRKYPKFHPMAKKEVCNDKP